jgi:co-chaperonin GroES (HSP10)
MVKGNLQSAGNSSNPILERRAEERIAAGKILDAVLLDPASKSYVPFKATVVNISPSGMQLAMKKGWMQVEEGAKILVNPPSAKEVTAKSKEAVVIWTKERGDSIIFGCAYL